MKIYNTIKKRLQSLPQYKIIRYHKGDHELFLVKERTGFFSFDYIMSATTIGADDVSYRIFFNTMDEAVNYINERIEKREWNRIVTETVKEL